MMPSSPRYTLCMLLLLLAAAAAAAGTGRIRGHGHSRRLTPTDDTYWEDDDWTDDWADDDWTDDWADDWTDDWSDDWSDDWADDAAMVGDDGTTDDVMGEDDIAPVDGDDDWTGEEAGDDDGVLETVVEVDQVETEDTGGEEPVAEETTHAPVPPPPPLPIPLPVEEDPMEGGDSGDYYEQPSKTSKHPRTSKGGKGTKSTKSSSRDTNGGGGMLPPPIPLMGEAFQFAKPGIPPTEFDPTTTAGTRYLFQEYVYDVSNVVVSNDTESIPRVPISLDGEFENVAVRVDGKCTRNAHVETGYCQFAYTISAFSEITFPDNTTEEIAFEVGSFIASGRITDMSENVGTSVAPLIVEGGFDFFEAATGFIIVEPANLDNNFDPPMVVSNEGDLFDDAAGYLHRFELGLDSRYIEMEEGNDDDDSTGTEGSRRRILGMLRKKQLRRK